VALKFPLALEKIEGLKPEFFEVPILQFVIDCIGNQGVRVFAVSTDGFKEDV